MTVGTSSSQASEISAVHSHAWLRNRWFVAAVVLVACGGCAIFLDSKYRWTAFAARLLPAQPPSHDASWETWQALCQIAMDALLALLWFCAYIPGSAIKHK